MRLPQNLLGPATRGWFQLGLQVLLALGLVIVLQVIATRHNVRFDLTPAQSFVLAPQSRQVAAAITEPLRITAFYNGQDIGQRREMLDVLEQFESAAPTLTFRIVDLDRSPALAKQYGISRYNTGVIEAGDQSVEIRGVNEPEITQALLKLSRGVARRLCFVTGHGERDPQSTDDRSGYSQVAKELERERFDIETWTTIPQGGIPEICTVVILAGPSHDLLPGEGDTLLRYLEAGGNVLLLADPDAPPTVLEFLKRTGIQAGNDLIVDEQNRFIGADSFMPQVVRFRTDLFRDSLNTPAVLALARTMRPLTDGPVNENVEVISIAATSPDSWALADPPADVDPDVRFRRGTDHSGPLSVGILARIGSDTSAATDADPPSTAAGRMIVFGDSDFASNFYLNLLGNKDLFMSSIALLAEDPELISERAKKRQHSNFPQISLTASEARTIFWLAVVVLPGTALLIGVAGAMRRRRRHGGR